MLQRIRERCLCYLIVDSIVLQLPDQLLHAHLDCPASTSFILTNPGYCLNRHMMELQVTADHRASIQKCYRGPPEMAASDTAESAC